MEHCEGWASGAMVGMERSLIRWQSNSIAYLGHALQSNSIARPCDAGQQYSIALPCTAKAWPRIAKRGKGIAAATRRGAGRCSTSLRAAQHSDAKHGNSMAWRCVARQ